MDKTIIINGIEYKYKIIQFTNTFGIYEFTKFYTDEIQIVKKYKWCGHKTITTNPIFLFKVPFNIEDINYTKEQVRTVLLDAEKKYRDLLNRRKEIENGEII